MATIKVTFDFETDDENVQALIPFVHKWVGTGACFLQEAIPPALILEINSIQSVWEMSDDYENKIVVSE